MLTLYPYTRKKGLQSKRPRVSSIVADYNLPNPTNMPRLNSRSKGRRGENKAKEVLQAWTGMDFHRVPASGGLQWKTANTVGDLVCGDPIHRFDFAIEVKNYKEINFEHLLMPNISSKILDEFWPQCLKDSKRGKKIPLLMMRYDNIKPGDLFFTVMRYSEFKVLKPHLNHDYPYLKFKGLIIMHSYMLMTSKYKTIKKLTEKIIKELWQS